MDNKRLSWGAHASPLSTRNPYSIWARVFFLALVLALGVASLRPAASASIAKQFAHGDKTSGTSLHFDRPAQDCQACQQELVQCLANGGGAICDIRYNACIETCE